MEYSLCTCKDYGEVDLNMLMVWCDKCNGVYHTGRTNFISVTPDVERFHISNILWLERLSDQGLHLLVFDDKEQVWNRMRQEDAEEIIRLLKELVGRKSE